MSNSQYKDFMTCEAAAMAKISGEFIDPPGDACLVGSYVHAWLEGTIDEFKESNPALFKQNGELYAKYEIADVMIDTLRRDPFCMFVLEGQKEVIMTAEFAGTVWKVKLDAYKPEKKRFADLKTVRNIRDKVWDDKIGYCSFVESYGYIRQMAVYAEVEKRWTGRDEWIDPLIVAVSKEEVPDKEVIGFSESDLQRELEEIETNMPKILEVKRGLREPDRCEKCKYCRQTKQIRGVLHYSMLVG
jgi:hypothetical protein